MNLLFRVTLPPSALSTFLSVPPLNVSRALTDPCLLMLPPFSSSGREKKCVHRLLFLIQVYLIMFRLFRSVCIRDRLKCVVVRFTDRAVDLLLVPVLIILAFVPRTCPARLVILRLAKSMLGIRDSSGRTAILERLLTIGILILFGRPFPSLVIKAPE